MDIKYKTKVLRYIKTHSGTLLHHAATLIGNAAFKQVKFCLDSKKWKAACCPVGDEAKLEPGLLQISIFFSGKT